MSDKYKNQFKRTKANKIKRLVRMLEQNPNNEQVKVRLDYWKNQRAE